MSEKIDELSPRKLMSRDVEAEQLENESYSESNVYNLIIKFEKPLCITTNWRAEGNISRPWDWSSSWNDNGD